MQNVHFLHSTFYINYTSIKENNVNSQEQGGKEREKQVWETKKQLKGKQLIK